MDQTPTMDEIKEMARANGREERLAGYLNSPAEEGETAEGVQEEAYKIAQ